MVVAAVVVVKALVVVEFDGVDSAVELICCCQVVKLN